MSDVKQKSTTSILVEAGLMVAMAIILNEFVSFHFWPNGGSVSLGGMVPILLLSYRHGTKWGLLGGFAFSIINFILGIKYLNGLTTLIFIGSVVLDYVLPFGILGLAGMFKNKLGNKSKEIVLGSSVVILIRYISHLLSGYILWGDIAGEGVWGAIVYTFTYNSSYMIPEWIISVVILLLLSKTAPKLLNA
ncbi:MAG: energy-coupled thiamine transporter ThiT [Oscillospiraceae bacterium]